MENDYHISWSELKILKVERDYSKRLITESWCITKEASHAQQKRCVSIRCSL